MITFNEFLIESKLHEVDHEAFQEWLKEKRVNFASSVGTVNKSLDIDLQGNFFVMHDKKEVWKGTDSKEAVKQYNAI
jgi:hypothetical protein